MNTAFIRLFLYFSLFLELIGCDEQFSKDMLFKSIEMNDLGMFRRIMESKVNEGGALELEYNLLHVASIKGSKDVLRYLILERKHDVNKLDGLGYSALTVAVQANHLEAVKILIELGAFTNLTHILGDSLLHFAARGGNLAIIEILLDHIDVDANNEYNETPAFKAVIAGNIEALRFLIDKGADPYTKDAYHDTLMHCAVRFDRLNIVKELIRYSGLINSKSVFDKLPLEVALSNNIEIIQELIENGSEIRDGFVWGTFNNREYELFKYLIRMSGKVDLKISARTMELCRESVAVVILKLDLYDLMQFILDQGADVNLKFCNKETILHWSAKYSKHNTLRIIHLLLDKGSDVNARDKNGLTPLDWSIHFQNDKVYNYLKQFGAYSSNTTQIPDEIIRDLNNTSELP